MENARIVAFEIFFVFGDIKNLSAVKFQCRLKREIEHIGNGVDIVIPDQFFKVRDKIFNGGFLQAAETGSSSSSWRPSGANAPSSPEYSSTTSAKGTPLFR